MCNTKKTNNLGIFPIVVKLCVFSSKLVFNHTGHGHLHPFHEIGFVEEGECIWIFRDGEILVPRYHALLVPRNTEHWERSSYDSGYKVHWLGFSFLEQVEAGVLDFWSKRPLPISNIYPEIIHRMTEIQEEIRGGLSGMKTRINLLAQDILLLTCRQSLQEDREQFIQASPLRGSLLSESQIQLITTAAHLLESHYTAPISIASVARKVGLSLPYFVTLFKRYFGYSPNQYLFQIRMNHARQLLEDSSLSIKQIALQTGFTDFPYFCRRFKKEFGISPSLYRAQVTPPSHTHQYIESN